MNNNPLISIVVPVYNSEEFLGQCVDSLINQTYQNIEIILVDDGSKDSSWFLCQEYQKKDKRVKAVHKENGGVSSARNLGISYATGEYLGFIDSDDYVSPELYSDMVDKLNENPGLDGIKYQYRYVHEGKLYKYTSSKHTGVIRFENKLQAMQMILVEKEFSSVAVFLFKKEKITHTFNERINMAEDYLFLMHYIMNAEAVYITNNIYYFYVQNPNSITHKSADPSKSLLYLKSQLTVCHTAKKYIDKYNLDELRNSQEKDIGHVIYYNLDHLFPDITYARYKKHIHDIQEMSEFKYFNRNHAYDPLLDTKFSSFEVRKITKTIKRLYKKITGLW